MTGSDDSRTADVELMRADHGWRLAVMFHCVVLAVLTVLDVASFLLLEAGDIIAGAPTAFVSLAGAPWSFYAWQV